MKYLIILLLFPISGLAQIITVDSSNSDYPFVRKNMYQFEYLHNDLDTSNYIWIADLTYHYNSLGSDTVTTTVYTKLGYKALELGANSFKIVKWNRQSKDTVATIKIYKLRDGKRSENLELFKENMVYVFGVNPFTKEGANYTIKINGVKTTIKANTYSEFRVNDGEELKIQFKKTKHVIKSEFQFMNIYYHPTFSQTLNLEKHKIRRLNSSSENLAYLLKIYDKN